MRVARVNGKLDPNHVELSDSELADRHGDARQRCPPCPACGGVGFIDYEPANGVDSGWCTVCKGRGFINDDPVLDLVVEWVCDRCTNPVIYGDRLAYCWHCRTPYDGADQDPIPLPTVDPITGDKLR